MYRTFGAPGVERTGAGHAGDDSPTVRPIRPENALPGLYSVKLMAPFHICTVTPLILHNGSRVGRPMLDILGMFTVTAAMT